jgi:hypothetical protein
MANEGVNKNVSAHFYRARAPAADWPAGYASINNLNARACQV